MPAPTRRQVSTGLRAKDALLANCASRVEATDCGRCDHEQDRRAFVNAIVFQPARIAVRRTTREGEQMPVIRAHEMSTGNLKGVDHGASISLILDHSAPGEGPRLHRHPYDETWVVVAGNITFQAGDERLDADPGDIVVVPSGIPHKFINRGRSRANLICIHANPTFDTEWLE